METFILIITYSVLVLLGLSTFGAVLVFASNWLVDNSTEPLSH